MRKSKSQSDIMEKYYKIKPVRPFNRFLKDAKDGINPARVYKQFIDKDIIRPYVHKGIYKPIGFQDRTQWSLSSAKNCPIENNLPKYQQYKSYNFYNFNDEAKKEKYRNYFLPTDHIAIRNAQEYLEKNNENKVKFPFLELKKSFGNQTEQACGWTPNINANDMKNDINNRSSVNYNIISNECKKESKNGMNVFVNYSVKPHYKKIGVGKYYDLTKTFCLNYNPQFQSAFNENSNVFKKFKGVFTKMYDDSGNNGGLYKPFESKKSERMNKIDNNL